MFQNFLAQHFPFIYGGSRNNQLVCIASGVTVFQKANPDSTLENGEGYAEGLEGSNFSHVKPKLMMKCLKHMPTILSIELDFLIMYALMVIAM